MAGERVQPSPGSTSVDLNPVFGQGSKAVNQAGNTVSSEMAEISGPGANAWLGLGCGSGRFRRISSIFTSYEEHSSHNNKNAPAESDMSWHPWGTDEGIPFPWYRRGH